MVSSSYEIPGSKDKNITKSPVRCGERILSKGHQGHAAAAATSPGCDRLPHFWQFGDFFQRNMNDSIGLREILQETIDFPVKYGAFL